MDINDLDYTPDDFDDSGVSYETEEPVYQEPVTPVQPVNPTPAPNEEEGEDVLKAFLRHNGISDPAHIKFEDDNGLIRDRDWNDLEAEEQLNILNSVHRDPDTELSADEIALLNSIRTSQLTPHQYLQNLIQQHSNVQEAPTEEFDITQMSDDDVFLIDLLSRYEDLTDEEATKALEQAKSDENLFKKQIQAIRTNVQARQQQVAKEQQEQALAQRQQYESSILDSIENLKSIGSMDLGFQGDEMEDLAQYILNTDSGSSAFGSALSDPNNLVKAAWFLKFGEEAFNEFNTILQQEVRKARQEGYDKAKAERQESQVVIKPKGVNAFGDRNITSIDDLYN